MQAAENAVDSSAQLLAGLIKMMVWFGREDQSLRKTKLSEDDKCLQFLEPSDSRQCVFVCMCSSEALYLSHLAMKRDSSDAKVPQQQRHPLGIVTRAAENYK